MVQNDVAKKGGRARAEKLSPERRKEIAAKAAAKRWEGKQPKPLKVLREGELDLGGLRIPCAVLEDGTRVLSQRGFWSCLAQGAPGRRRDERDDDFKLPSFLATRNLKPFVSAELTTTATNPVLYFHGTGHHGGGNVAHGIRAELIPSICDVWLKARQGGALHYKQREIAEKAELVMRSLAHVGIIALVDEATGYQYDRARTALAEIFEKFIAKELAPWVKTFDDDFYREMYRLRGAKRLHNSRRPKYFGLLTTDIVYKRLAPEILDELQRLNPKLERGRRAHSHHQWLTRDAGHPALRVHIAKVTMMMQLSPDWATFKRNLNAFLPKFGENWELRFKVPV
jgi:hypothetical protein